MIKPLKVFFSEQIEVKCMLVSGEMFPMILSPGMHTLLFEVDENGTIIGPAPITVYDGVKLADLEDPGELS